MSSDQRSREGRPADVRPKRQVRPPAWLEDYDVSLPHYDEPSPVVQTAPLTTEEQEPYHRIERVAEMTPLTHHTLRHFNWTQAEAVYPFWPGGTDV